MSIRLLLWRFERILNKFQSLLDLYSLDYLNHIGALVNTIHFWLPDIVDSPECPSEY